MADAHNDVVVVGGGMMGAPCARHLAEAGHDVALVAAPEPAPGGPGPFASHHDAGRITRHVAADPDWARLAARSIGRYRDLEARSGRAIFAEVGAVMAGFDDGPMAGYTGALQAVAAGVDPAPAPLAGDGAGWTLPPGSAGVWERAGGGWIDPRAMCAAQAALAGRAGAAVHAAHARSRDGRDVVLADGTRLSAGHVVVATGPHAATDGLLPRRPAMTVQARTVVFWEVSEVEARRLSALPTCIWVPGPDWDHTLYALPPIRYPDGRWRIKVGGEKGGRTIRTEAEMAAWFHGPGDPAVGARLSRALRAVLPGVAVTRETTAPCAVVWTETGHAYVDAAGDGITVLTGGNGAAAKCGDELGRLGAIRATGGTLSAEGYRATFEAAWD